MSAYGLTPKQEAFAVAYLKHGNATQAYKDAGYAWENMTESTLNGEASRLLKHPQISRRVRESQERAAKKVDYTLEKALEFAMEDRDQAKELGQMGAANAANKLAAELMGMLNHKQTLKVEMDPWEQILNLVDGKSRDLETRH